MWSEPVKRLIRGKFPWFHTHYSIVSGTFNEFGGVTRRDSIGVRLARNQKEESNVNPEP